ncbi:uncharacterized protein LOC142345976 isoform X2 [Convolutriloba macropyga]|uniref:uncharacterized protein LOC142345976 isoform X2 n=1 Tax=Convolutriloba macropyga TaxID=536237 RepID=UPI003F528404
MLNSFLWSLGANGCSGYTGVITNGDNSYNFSLGLWKTCLNDECQTYKNLSEFPPSFQTRLKLARALFLIDYVISAAACWSFLLFCESCINLVISFAYLNLFLLVSANVCHILAYSGFSVGSYGFSCLVPCGSTLTATVALMFAIYYKMKKE